MTNTPSQAYKSRLCCPLPQTTQLVLLLLTFTLRKNLPCGTSLTSTLALPARRASFSAVCRARSQLALLTLSVLRAQSTCSPSPVLGTSSSQTSVAKVSIIVRQYCVSLLTKTCCRVGNGPGSWKIAASGSSTNWTYEGGGQAKVSVDASGNYTISGGSNTITGTVYVNSH
jgi:hypothetical protein